MSTPATESPARAGRALLGQFTGLVLLAVFLPVVVLAGVLLWQATMSVRAQSSAMLSAAARAGAYDLDSFLRTHLAAMQVLADRRDGTPVAADPEDWRADLVRIGRHYPAFAHLLVADAEGNVVASSPSLPPDEGPHSVVDRDYFQAPRRSGGPHVSRVYTGRGDAPGPRIAVSVPLTRDGRVTGVLAGTMPARALLSHGGLAAHGFELLLLDADLGVVEASEGVPYRPLDRLDGAPRDRAIARLADDTGTPGRLDAVLGDGDDAFAVAAPLDNGWRLLLMQPRGAVEAELRRTAMAMLAVLALVLAGVLVVVVGRMRRLGASVRRLLRQMRQFALDGGSAPISAGDMPHELLPLAEAMNALAERARASFDEVNHSLQEQRRLRQELQSVAQRLLTVQEDERRTLSRELHDDIGQSITAIKLAATSLNDEEIGGDPAQRHEILDELVAIADQTVLKLRNLSLLLRPPQLDSLGLEPALRGQVARLARNTGLDIQLQVASADARLPADVELACFRIAQEALTNAARHAGAREVRVDVDYAQDGDGDLLVLRVSDDGRGLEPGRPGGIGLMTMRERASQLGGSVVVEPRSGGGTVVVALLPLPR